MPAEAELRFSCGGNRRTSDLRNMWGFPRIRGTIMGVPIIRIIVFGGLYWGPLFWETPMF